MKLISLLLKAAKQKLFEEVVPRKSRQVKSKIGGIRKRKKRIERRLKNYVDVSEVSENPRFATIRRPSSAGDIRIKVRYLKRFTGYPKNTVIVISLDGSVKGDQVGIYSLSHLGLRSGWMYLELPLKESYPEGFRVGLYPTTDQDILLQARMDALLEKSRLEKAAYLEERNKRSKLHYLENRGALRRETDSDIPEWIKNVS